MPISNEDNASLPELFVNAGRVLIADDDGAMRELLCDALKRDGRDVEEVGSGEDLVHVFADRAVARWPADAFGVIVTDHHMPRGDGLDVVEQLRRSGCSIPVLLVTAFADEDLRRRAHLADAMVLSKPFSLRAFRTAVSVLLSIHP